jgi:glycosyltransferase involved in cell wall biosynthesis
MKVAILIPAFNEEDTVIKVVDKVRQYGRPIVVDDCSTDGTYARCISERVDVVHHRVNLGYDSALQSGFERASELGMDIVITFDADGQHSASALKKVLELLIGDEVEMVLGVRTSGPARISEVIFNLYVKLRFGVDDILCGLKGYKMKLYEVHGRFDGVNSIGTELALASLRRGVVFQQIQVPTFARVEGDTRFGGLIRGNGRIFRAFFQAILEDFRNIGMRDE